jgi:phospholipid transport system substrate-binding protein
MKIETIDDRMNAAIERPACDDRAQPPGGGPSLHLPKTPWSRMIMRRPILIGLLALSLGALMPFPSMAVTTEEGARQFVQGLAERTIDTLKANSPKAEQDRRFSEIFGDGFDVRSIAVFCLGGYWKRATGQEQQEYVGLFRDLIVQTYSRRLGSIYHGEKLVVGAARPDGKDGAWVSSQIVSQDKAKQPIPIEWRVRLKGGTSYQVIDVVVTGVSMVVTQRDDFVSFLQRNEGNLRAFLDMLRDKVKQLQAG